MRNEQPSAAESLPASRTPVDPLGRMEPLVPRQVGVAPKALATLVAAVGFLASVDLLVSC